MNEKLKEFLDTEKKKKEEEKNEMLIELDLYEKVYSPDNSISDEYPFSESTSGDSVVKYYKKVPIEITDEEYQEVMKYNKQSKKREKNPVVKALTIIALAIFVVGFIGGIILASNIPFAAGFAVAFMCWCASFISGMTFIGFAEIIELLNDIKNK